GCGRRPNTLCQRLRSSPDGSRRRAISLSSDARSGSTGQITTRGMALKWAGSGGCTVTVDDAIDPVPVDLLRVQIEAELLAHHHSPRRSSLFARPSHTCQLSLSIKQGSCRFPERPSTQRSACARKTYVSSRCSAGSR